MHDDTVRTLTARMAAGDSQAIRDFYARYAEWIYTVARRSKHDEAFCLDIVQDVAIRVIEKIRPISNDAKLRVWLERIIRSCIVDRIRSELRRAEREERYARMRTGESHRKPSLERELLASLLHDLPPEQLQLLRLRFANGFTLAHVGEVIGINAEAADSRLRRIIHTLRGRLPGNEHV